MSRPCRYCLAAYPILFEDGDTSACELTHRDEERIYDLAYAIARMVHWPMRPSDEQVGWFLHDAEDVVDDFDPVPEKWRLRKLPADKSGEFTSRFRINDVTYVVLAGEGFITPVRLSELRQQQRESDEEAMATRL